MASLPDADVSTPSAAAAAAARRRSQEAATAKKIRVFRLLERPARPWRVAFASEALLLLRVSLYGRLSVADCSSCLQTFQTVLSMLCY